MSTTIRLISAEELFAMGDIGRCELIRGEIIHMAPAGAEHGDLGAELLHRIKLHVDAHKMGRVFAADTGFIIARDPDTVRAPDVAFVSRDRLPAGRVRAFFPGAPDLAVEVISPSDRASEVLAKVDEWLAAGTKSVWVVDPPNYTIAIYQANNRVSRYRKGDELRDDGVLPGFALKVGELFDMR